MSKKASFVLLTLLTGIVGFITPVWADFTCLFISGHAKGYDYNLGDEKDISIFFGSIALVIGLIYIFSVLFLSCRRYARIKKILTPVPLLIFLMFFCLGIKILGVKDFLNYLHIRI